VGILTNAGGPGILAADACEANGLSLPALAEETREALRAFLPAAASIGNPVDMIASAPPDHYERATRLMLADPGMDSLLTIFIPPLVTEPRAVADAIVRGAAGTSKTVLATFMRAQGAPPELGSIPSYMFPEAAATALARVAAHGEWRRRPQGRLPVLAGVSRDAARAIVDRALAHGGGWLVPNDVHALLEAYGIASAAPVAAANEGEAVAAARRIGYPVAMKVVGPAIVHKTEVGGVLLGLTNDDAVGAGYGSLAARLGSAMTGVILQRMVPNGVEVIVGATEDPSFGPVIACGTGGTLVELFKDVVFRLHPLTDIDAADMINEMRGAPLLRGYRGAAVVDEGALRDVLLRVSALVDACPEIQELDINPLRVLPNGVCALDARIRVALPMPAHTRRITY
jgi:acyl-CoA synthetase (NDP forming)